MIKRITHNFNCENDHNSQGTKSTTENPQFQMPSMDFRNRFTTYQYSLIEEISEDSKEQNGEDKFPTDPDFFEKISNIVKINVIKEATKQPIMEFHSLIKNIKNWIGKLYNYNNPSTI
jgi:hypothetical protein